MNTIHKFPLEIQDRQVINIPSGSVIMSAQFQNNVLCLWAEVNTEMPMKPCWIGIFGTGNPIARTDKQFIATVQQPNTPFVWHVYQLI